MRWIIFFIIACAYCVQPIYAQTPIEPNFDALPPCEFGMDSDIPGLVVGALVYNFENNRGCQQNLDLTFPIASVPKIFVSGAYHKLVAQGVVSPSDTMRFDETYYMAGAFDCLNADDIGRDVTLRELDQVMIACSDNAATWMLMDRMGWDYVQYYVETLGIPGIGEVIPYSLVDRIKLAYIDPEWNNVPLALASQYMRSRNTEELEDYFDQAPRYTRSQMRQAAQLYFDNNSYNTATPRAMGLYFNQLRNDYLTDFGEAGQIADGVLGTLLNTQRQYSAQSFPGTVYIGSKNGFDTGLVAEVNFTVSTLSGYNRTPETIAIIFTRQTDLTVNNVQRPSQSAGPLHRLLWDISPQMVEILFESASIPPMTNNWMINTVRFSSSDAVDNCWLTYELANFDPEFVTDYEGCLGQTPQQTMFQVGDRIALGLVLRGMNYQDTRLTFIYTEPDGDQKSYQVRAPVEDQVGVNWFHPVNESGIWTLDIYVNLELAYSNVFSVAG